MAARVVTALLAAASAGAVILPPGAASAAPTPTPTAAQPESVVMVGVRVLPGQKKRYGIGQLVTLKFETPVTRRAAVEKAIKVTSDKELSAGSWAWVNDMTAVYRPKRFWPANARITFTLPLAGLVLGQDGTTRYVAEGRRDRKYMMRTTRSFVMNIEDKRHRMTVKKDGRTVKKFGVSLGKPGWETRSGIKILTDEKYKRLRMTGYDPGKKEHWDVIAPYSIRLTPTGEFIHGAPWAKHRIGKWDGSHGCTNMRVRDARWLYHHSQQGDPVITKSTGRPMQVTNGTPGSYWNYSWGEWKRMSATFRGKDKPSDPARAMTLPPPAIDAGP